MESDIAIDCAQFLGFGFGAGVLVWVVGFLYATGRGVLNQVTTVS